MGFGWAGRVSFFSFFRVSFHCRCASGVFPFTARMTSALIQCLYYSIYFVVSLLPCHRPLSKCMNN